jgi:hypothetical protein
MYTKKVRVRLGDLFFPDGMLVNFFLFQAGRDNHNDQVVLCGMLSSRGKGSVGGGEVGKKTKTMRVENL